MQVSRKKRDFSLITSKYDMLGKSPEEEDPELRRKLDIQQKEGDDKLLKTIEDYKSKYSFNFFFFFFNKEFYYWQYYLEYNVHFRSCREGGETRRGNTC